MDGEVLAAGLEPGEVLRTDSEPFRERLARPAPREAHFYDPQADVAHE